MRELRNPPMEKPDGQLIEKPEEMDIDQQADIFDILEDLVEVERPESEILEEAIDTFWRKLEEENPVKYDLPRGPILQEARYDWPIDNRKFERQLEENKSFVNAERGAELADPTEDEGDPALSDSNEVQKKGGSYEEVYKPGEGDTIEVHHIPADSVTELPYKDGPAIRMEKGDHQKTASYGSSNEAKAYRSEQKKLIEEGKFREAVQMDIDDIRDKFGDKYDDAIEEMNNYIDKLEAEGKINA